MKAYIRKRTVPLQTSSKTFLEFYLYWDGSYLTWPHERVARFEKRILKEHTLDPSQWTSSYLDPNYESSITLLFVDSTATTKVVKRTKEDIQNDGIWSVYDDTVPKGNFSDPSQNIEVESQSTLYGIPIDPNIWRILCFGLKHMYGTSPWSECRIQEDPLVVYHGTDKQIVPSIIKEGLKPTFGMLGTGIYFGTFWKSFRFATRTQDYVKREGAILRCFAFWTSMAYKTGRSDSCACKECAKALKVRSKQKREDAIFKTRFCDHQALLLKFYEAVRALPEAGSPIKNEEYVCLNNSKVYMDTVAYAISTTEHHEALNRALTIL
jgi:hypothetical protein